MAFLEGRAYGRLITSISPHLKVVGNPCPINCLPKAVVHITRGNNQCQQINEDELTVKRSDKLFKCYLDYLYL